jgi:DNA-binding protein H-NS
VLLCSDSAIRCSKIGLRAPTVRSVVVLYGDHRSPSIVAENSSTGPKSSNAIDLASMSVDELWQYRERIDVILRVKIATELTDLKRRLDLLNSKLFSDQCATRKRLSPAGQRRRSYPSVQPKYRNPEEPSETWAGRGRQPRWVQMQLSLGKRLEDFRIGKPEQRRVAVAYANRSA